MHRPIGTLALLGAAALSGCSKEAPKADTTPVAQSGASTPAAPKAAYDPTTRVATIIARDFAFETPDSIPGGWTTLRLVNDGQTLHHVQLVRLDGGKTVADLQAAMKNPGPPPSWMVEVGGPNAPDPKSESNATLDLAPGNYVLLCFVDIPDHVPHFAKGMVHPLTVTAAASAATAPTADLTVAVADYKFTVNQGTLSAGKHTVKLVNDGPQPHEIELVRFAPGKSMKDLGAWMQKMDGPPPASAIGGVSGVAKGATAYFDVELTPGSYAFVCFIPDAKDGKPHVEHGMMKEFTVQ